jgi:hypothetical protein
MIKFHTVTYGHLLVCDIKVSCGSDDDRVVREIITNMNIKYDFIHGYNEINYYHLHYEKDFNYIKAKYRSYKIDLILK